MDPVSQIVYSFLVVVLFFGLVLAVMVLFDYINYRDLQRRLREERERDTGGEGSKD